MTSQCALDKRSNPPSAATKTVKNTARAAVAMGVYRSPTVTIRSGPSAIRGRALTKVERVSKPCLSGRQICPVHATPQPIAEPIRKPQIAFVGQKDDFKKTINILQSITNGIKMNYIISNNNNKLIPVRSTFNGAAIYKIDSVLDSQYDSEYCCEHVDFHKRMISNNHNLLFINPNFLGYMGLQGPRENILSIFKSII